VSSYCKTKHPKSADSLPFVASRILQTDESSLLNFELSLDEFGRFESCPLLSSNAAKQLESERVLSSFLSQLQDNFKQPGRNELARRCKVHRDRVSAYLGYISGFHETSIQQKIKRSDIVDLSIASHHLEQLGRPVDQECKSSGKNLTTFDLMTIDAALLLLEKRYGAHLMQLSWCLNTSEASTKMIIKKIKKYLKRVTDWLHAVFRTTDSIARLEKGKYGTFHVHLYTPNVACRRLDQDMAEVLSKILIASSPSEFLFNGYAPDIHITSGFRRIGTNLFGYAAKRSQTAKVWNGFEYKYPECHHFVSQSLQSSLDADLLDVAIACVYSRSELREFAEALNIELHKLCNPFKAAPDAYLGNVSFGRLKECLLTWKHKSGNHDQSIHLQYYQCSGHLLLTPSKAQRQPVNRLSLPADRALLQSLLRDDRVDSSQSLVKRQRQDEKAMQRAAEKEERQRLLRERLLAERQAELAERKAEAEDDFDSDDSPMIQLSVS
jgi:hypothetical protein